MSKIKLIVAVSDNQVIGNNGTIPWALPEEMHHFRDTTMGQTVVMGSKTWESILPYNSWGFLDGRYNIVLTSSFEKRDQLRRQYPHDHPYLDFHGPDFDIKSEQSSIGIFREDADIYIIGGSQIYNKYLKEDVVDEIILTRVKMRFKGDAKFPDLDPNKWTLLSVENRQYFDIQRYQVNK